MGLSLNVCNIFQAREHAGKDYANHQDAEWHCHDVELYLLEGALLILANALFILPSPDHPICDARLFQPGYSGLKQSCVG